MTFPDDGEESSDDRVWIVRRSLPTYAVVHQKVAL